MDANRKGDIPMTLTEYLDEERRRGNFEHVLKASHVDHEGFLHCYVHPTGKDGQTLDFKVRGTELHIKHQ